MVIDMGVLFLLADPRTLDLNVTLSKLCASEIAMINNFIWNELWTFRRSPSRRPPGKRPRGGPLQPGEKGTLLFATTETACTAAFYSSTRFAESE